VHRAMIEALQIPPGDCFQVITEHPTEALIYDSQYLRVRRSDNVVFVQITLSAGRKPQQKRKLFKRMAENSGGVAGIEALGSGDQFWLKWCGRIGRSGTEERSIWIRSSKIENRKQNFSYCEN
jgi:tautomerase-like protein